MKIYQYRKIIIGIILVIILILLIPRFTQISVEDILSHTPESLPLAALTLLGIYCIKSFIMVIPVAILYISAGLLFPTGWAIVISYACLIVELSVGYLIGYQINTDKINKLINKNKKVRHFFSLQNANSGLTCFFARLFPLPLDIISLYFGASKVKYLTYLGLSLLGLSPKMIPYVIAGGAITTPLSPEFIIPFSISIAITIIIFFVYRKFAPAKKNESDK